MTSYSCEGEGEKGWLGTEEPGHNGEESVGFISKSMGGGIGDV